MNQRMNEFSSKLRQRIRGVRMVLMDVDGVLTNGQLFIGDHGEALKVFYVQDGLAIHMARSAGLKLGIISGRYSEAVENRSKELHFDVCYQGVVDKLESYQHILENYDFQDEDICYVGDDLLDLPLMKRVGLAVAVANASEEVKNTAHIITERCGGKGGLREIIEIILRIQNKWKKIVEKVTH